jgi:hypothetical protein
MTSLEGCELHRYDLYRRRVLGRTGREQAAPGRALPPLLYATKERGFDSRHLHHPHPGLRGLATRI